MVFNSSLVAIVVGILVTLGLFAFFSGPVYFLVYHVRRGTLRQWRPWKFLWTEVEYEARNPEMYQKYYWPHFPSVHTEVEGVTRCPYCQRHRRYRHLQLFSDREDARVSKLWGVIPTPIRSTEATCGHGC